MTLKDENPFVRLSAAEALGKIKDPKAVNALLDALDEENGEKESKVREAIINAFTDIFLEFFSGTGSLDKKVDSILNDLSGKSKEGIGDSTSRGGTFEPPAQMGTFELAASVPADFSGTSEEGDSAEGADQGGVDSTPTDLSGTSEDGTGDNAKGQDQGGFDPSKIDLSGEWYSVIASSHKATITGLHPSYNTIGTNGNYEHKCTLTFDGKYYKGQCSDTPGKCCGNNGEVWISVIDEGTIKVKSRWWPKNNDYKPFTNEWLTDEAGWEDFVRAKG
jgi:hypothetical protein